MGPRHSIAKQVKADDKKVDAVRRELEANLEIPNKTADRREAGGRKAGWFQDGNVICALCGRSAPWREISTSKSDTAAPAPGMSDEQTNGAEKEMTMFSHDDGKMTAELTCPCCGHPGLVEVCDDAVKAVLEAAEASGLLDAVRLELSYRCTPR